MDKNLKKRIIETALDIVDEEGFECLSQPRLAQRLGIRQSHLTYYFPHKADLIVALLEGSHRRAENASKAGDVLDTLEAIIFDRKRMRFFLGELMEVSEDSKLRETLAEHSRKLHAEIGKFYGVKADDTRVVNFLALSRGLGIDFLINPDKYAEKIPSLRNLASECGLEESGLKKI
jgi:AcrR family transcriptional regulator